MKTEYEINTAITFLMVGMGAGAILALLLAPRRGLRAGSPYQVTARHEKTTD